MKKLLKSLVPKFILGRWKSFKHKLNLKIRIFRTFEKMGVHVIPVHYYSAVPDTRELLANKQHWNKEYNLKDLNFNEEEQLRLNDIFAQFKNELESLPSFDELRSRGFGPGYG